MAENGRVMEISQIKIGANSWITPKTLSRTLAKAAGQISKIENNNESAKESSALKLRHAINAGLYLTEAKIDLERLRAEAAKERDRISKRGDPVPANHPPPWAEYLMEFGDFRTSKQGDEVRISPKITTKQARLYMLIHANSKLAKVVSKGAESFNLAGICKKITNATPEQIAKSSPPVKEITAATNTLTGTYDVIVIDPPWPMRKIERDVRPNQESFDYPTMNEDALAKIQLPAARHCHLFCWTTQKFLPMTLRLFEAWGVRYVLTMVWHKPGGFQPIGLPQYNCEFVIYGRIGSPEFVDTKAFNACFNAPRGAHSEKPEEFYDVLRRVTGGKRIDIFNRRPINGFDLWGNESGEVAA